MFWKKKFKPVLVSYKEIMNIAHTILNRRIDWVFDKNELISLQELSHPIIESNYREKNTPEIIVRIQVKNENGHKRTYLWNRDSFNIQNM